MRGRLYIIATLLFAASASYAATPRTAFVHLFEWKWTDIAKECENFLGPKGFAAIQISPPQEHVIVQGRPWYERYQPVSYKIESRGGTRAEFADMVRRCKAVGVDIYADAVINHTVGRVFDGKTHYGSAGSSYADYEHTGLYDSSDFHRCGRNGDDSIYNYSDRWEVQNCNLAGCQDLRTEAEHVRSVLAGYLGDLLSLGVTGFRIDAAKHIPSQDLDNIFARVKNPFVYLEVVGNESEPIKVGEYLHIGPVSEFKFGNDLGRIFRWGKLSWLQSFGESWGYLSSSKAIVFLANHDTERSAPDYVLTYRNGKQYVLGNVFMLAWPYGYPQVLSDYPFSDPTSGPPTLPDGQVLPIYDTDGIPSRCFKEWGCQHRIPAIANMVGFRNYTNSDFSITKWWTDGENRIAFARGRKGYVVINNTAGTLTNWFDTGLPAGFYCDITTGEPQAGGTTCSGKTIQVNASGWSQIEVAPFEAAAIYGGAMVAIKP